MSDRSPMFSDPARPLVRAWAALAQLEAANLPEGAAMAMGDLRAALQDLDTSVLNELDPAALDELFKMAGPDLAQDLQAQMLTDLQAIRQALEHAFPQGDLDTIRAQTHVLCSLAGAAGAHALEHYARALNLAVHDKDEGRIRLLQTSIQTGLTSLIDHVASARISPFEAGS